MRRHEPDQHHRAANFRSDSRLFPEFRRGYNAQVSSEHLSNAGAVFYQRFRIAEANHVGPQWIKIIGRARKRERVVAGGQSAVAGDQFRVARCGTRSEPPAARVELSRALGVQIDSGGDRNAGCLHLVAHGDDQSWQGRSH